MPLPPPTALNVGRWGASIELSEVCSSVGQLEARAGEGLALAPLTESAVMDLPAGSLARRKAVVISSQSVG
jgi:hypothetical protein